MTPIDDKQYRKDIAIPTRHLRQVIEMADRDDIQRAIYLGPA